MDDSVWGFHYTGGYGSMFSGGSQQVIDGSYYRQYPAASAGVLEVKLQRASGAAEFWQAGKQLGRVTGLPAAVKLVVSLYFEGQYVKLL